MRAANKSTVAEYVLVMFIDKNIKAVFSAFHDFFQFFIIVCTSLPCFFQNSLQQDDIFPCWTFQNVNLSSSKLVVCKHKMMIEKYLVEHNICVNNNIMWEPTKCTRRIGGAFKYSAVLFSAFRTQFRTAPKIIPKVVFSDYLQNLP